METYREIFNKMYELFKKREEVSTSKEREKINEKIDELNNHHNIEIPAILLTIESVESILKKSKKLDQNNEDTFYFIMEPLCKDNFESNNIRREKLISLLNELIISKDEKEIKNIENEIKRINYFECENEYYFDLLPNWFNDMDDEDNSVGDFMWSYPEYYLEINFIKDILKRAHLDKLYDNYFEVCEDYEEYEEEVYDEEK